MVLILNTVESFSTHSGLVILPAQVFFYSSEPRKSVGAKFQNVLLSCCFVCSAVVEACGKYYNIMFYTVTFSFNSH